MWETLGNYGFHFLDDVENPPVQLVSTGVEKRDNSNYYFDNRTRPKTYLFQYTLGGSGTVVLHGEPKKVYPGDAFFLKLPDNDQYFFDPLENESPWHFIFIMFRGDGAEEYYQRITQKLGNIIHLPQNAQCIGFLTELCQNAADGLIKEPFTGSSMTFGFLCSLCSFAMGTQNNPGRIVELATQMMEQEFSTLLGVSEVAERLSVSLNHLSREFVRTMGVTPISYLIKMRLEKAVELLHNTSLPVEKIAVMSGFSCGNYFCKVFRRYLKLSPKAFRDHKDILLYTKVRL